MKKNGKSENELEIRHWETDETKKNRKGPVERQVPYANILIKYIN